MTFLGYKKNRQTIKHTDKQSINILGFKAALRPSSILTFNCGTIFEHLLFVRYKPKRKNVRGFSNIFACVLKRSCKLKAFGYNFLKLWSVITYKPSLGSWSHELHGVVWCVPLRYLIFMPRTGHVLIFSRFFFNKFSGSRFLKGINQTFVSIFSIFFKLPLVIYFDFIKGVFGIFFSQSLTVFSSIFTFFSEIAWNTNN